MKDRRQFLLTLARGGIFASLTALFGVMIIRRDTGTDCNHNFACGNCGSITGCRLPEADNHRLNLARAHKVNQKDGRIGK